MRVTLLQTDIVWAQPDANIQAARQLLSQSGESDLYVLPEMWSTGFATEPEGIAVSEDSNAALEWMREEALRRQCAICGSLAVRTADGAYRNRHYFVDGRSSGISHYDKRHLFSYGHEDRYYTAGQAPCIVNYDGFRLLLLTCYDLRFPVWSRYASGHEYDAIVIATGTPTARDLKAPGRELKGVHFALELLSQQNRVLAGMEFSRDERITAKNKDVLVIGGGDTGSDCIGTAHRQGCKSVTQIEIMPKPVEGPEDPQNPWPNWPRTLKTTSSHEEGCTRRWNINTLEFLGENGKLTGVKVQEIDWKPNPDGGRPLMVEKGKPEIIKAELCLLAMGFLKPEHPQYPDHVFVCGDAHSGASLVVRAMASGLETAKKVNEYLTK